MGRYKIATKTDTLRYRIAKEVFGEIEDSDGVRDIPSWEIFEKCLEQNNQLADLEAKLAEKDEEIKQLKSQSAVDEDWLCSQRTRLTELEDELALKEKEVDLWKKAFEIAIFELDFYKNHSQSTNEETIKRIEQLYETILKRAKSLKGEK